MRKVSANIEPGCTGDVHRVVELEHLAAVWEPELRFLVLAQKSEDQCRVVGLRSAGLSNVAWVAGAGLEAGDIVVPRGAKSELIVLLRRSDAHHALFMTNQCNSYCLMCSQPPTKEDDSWLIEEALQAIRHLDWAPRVLGLTGGEPLLLRHGLRQILDEVGRRFPETVVEVLTNGRMFSDRAVVNEILTDLHTPVRWLVPLYGHANFLHDFVVQSPGAFDETIAGLLALQEHGQAVQLRSVLIPSVLENLPELSNFVARNLPFVREWALMGCEPIGFALANREQCEVDLTAWAPALEQTSRTLRTYGVRHVLMNTPLCSLPQSLWPWAHKSISDWKNVYAQECEGCAVREDCVGLFAWHERGWTPAPLKRIETSEISL